MPRRGKTCFKIRHYIYFRYEQSDSQGPDLAVHHRIARLLAGYEALTRPAPFEEEELQG